VEPKFSAVLFDCDGVLVDSESITNSVLRQMLIEMGWDISTEECIRIFIGKALKDQWEPILENTGVRIDEAWISTFRARRDAALRTDLQPITGALKTVQAIHELYGESIACVTGADRTKVEMQLEITGLSEYFGDRVFSGMECAKSKPAPDVYLAAATSLGIAPEEALVIEDTATGVAAGIGAGATVFGFSNNGPTSTAPQKLLDAGVALVFNDMAELPDLASQ